MNDRSLSKRRASACVTAFALLLLLGPQRADASPETLRIAFEDILMGVADVVVSPVNAGMATAENLDAVSDNPILQGLYVVPGFLGLGVLQAGQAALRIATGVVQILPGLALFPFEADLSEDFNVFRRGTLMVDAENPLGKSPPWLTWVLPVIPVTIDARIGPMCPWAVYPDEPREEMSVAIR